jgi:palmitoyltransferase
MKAFLLILWLTPILVIFNLAPISSPLWSHFRQAYRISWTSPAIRKNWWNWKGSWFVCAGPVGRYARGIYLGYRVLAEQQQEFNNACYFEQAHLSSFVAASVAVILAIFTLVRQAGKGIIHAQ